MNALIPGPFRHVLPYSVRVILATFTLMFCLSICAHADSFQRMIFGGEETILHAYFTWDWRTCLPNIGTVKVLSYPKHGKLSHRIVYRTIWRVRFNHRISRCAGKRVKALAVIYRPDSGYAGIDTVALNVRYGNGTQFIDAYQLDVRP